MRTDKNGHAWKRQDGTAKAVCPLCGIESKVTPRGPKGGSLIVYREIGTDAAWSPAAPKCSRHLHLGQRFTYRGKSAVVLRVMHAWPPRFECVDQRGRVRIVPVIAYWRARRSA